MGTVNMDVVYRSHSVTLTLNPDPEHGKRDAMATLHVVSHFSEQPCPISSCNTDCKPLPCAWDKGYNGHATRCVPFHCLSHRTV